MSKLQVESKWYFIYYYVYNKYRFIHTCAIRVFWIMKTRSANSLWYWIKCILLLMIKVGEMISSFIKYEYWVNLNINEKAYLWIHCNPYVSCHVDVLSRNCLALFEINFFDSWRFIALFYEALFYFLKKCSPTIMQRKETPLNVTASGIHKYL